MQIAIIQGLLELCFLPYKVYYSAVAIVKTIYRKNFSKKHLLEWQTSEEAEKLLKNDLISIYKIMWFNILSAVIILFIQNNYYFSAGEKAISIVLGIMWIIAPLFAFALSQKLSGKTEKLENTDKEHLVDIAKKTWSYFEAFLTKDTNFLPPDNYQENRKEEIVYRTSSTNIGLALMSVISAYNLKFIEKEQALNLIKNTLDTVQKLQTWNGHLYNWYNIKTLEPLYPRYISTVDSGNFIGYLYCVKSFLEEEKTEEYEWVNYLIKMVEDLINKTDFKVLFDEKRNIFSIGFNVEQNKLEDSYYDLLASEARQASFVAISKNNVPSKHWYKLTRTLTAYNGYKGLLSWSGTAFEYMMPNLNMKQYERKFD
jgi:cyclic beta-1,2-glucan synthetase